MKLFSRGRETRTPNCGFGDRCFTIETMPLFIYLDTSCTFKTSYKTLPTSLPLAFLWSKPRPISNGQLHVLPHFHLRPIYLVVFKGSYYLTVWEILSLGGLHAQMPSAFIPSRLGYSAMHLAVQQIHQRSVHPGPLVLRTAPIKSPPPAPDRDRTVSRRSEPSSRTALMGEQPNPWNLLQLQDAMSRHRGAKPLRRCELLGVISLLSPGQLLSVERWQSHVMPPDH